jgi:hypothetical protein
MVKGLARGFLHANLGHGTGDKERGDLHLAQPVGQLGAVKTAIAMLSNDEIALLGIDLAYHIGAFELIVGIQIASAQARAAGGCRRLALRRPHPEQARLGCRQEFRVDDGRADRAEARDQPAMTLEGRPRVGNFHRRALAHEIVLHVHDKQGGRIKAGNRKRHDNLQYGNHAIMAGHDSNWRRRSHGHRRLKTTLASDNRRDTGFAVAKMID